TRPSGIFPAPRSAPKRVVSVRQSNAHGMETNMTRATNDPPATPAAGTMADTRHDREVPEIDLLTPLTIRDVTFRNRIAMSQMCQYARTRGWPTTGTWFTWAAGRRAARPW